MADVNCDAYCAISKAIIPVVKTQNQYMSAETETALWACW